MLLRHLDPPDLEGAHHWLERAAEAGHTGPQFNLGALLEGLDPPDLEGARRWYARAAEADKPTPQLNLGPPKGGPQDESQ